VPSDWSISELRGHRPSPKPAHPNIPYYTRSCTRHPQVTHAPASSLLQALTAVYNTAHQVEQALRPAKRGSLRPSTAPGRSHPQPCGRSHPPSRHKTPSRWSSKFSFTPLSYCDPALASTIRMDEMSTRIPRGLNSTFKMSFTKVLSPADSFTVEEVRLYSTSSSRYGNSHG